MSDKVDTFLSELSALSRKHGVYIRGCGCCGSPSLTMDDGVDVDHAGCYAVENGGDNLEWNSGRKLAGEAVADSLSKLAGKSYRYNEHWNTLQSERSPMDNGYIGLTADLVLIPCCMGELTRKTLDALAAEIGGTVGKAMAIKEWENMNRG